MKSKQLLEQKQETKSVENCNECGRSVIFGSGWYVNRVPDFNDKEIRIEMGKSFPQGDFICSECNE